MNVYPYSHPKFFKYILIPDTKERRGTVSEWDLFSKLRKMPITIFFKSTNFITFANLGYDFYQISSETRHWRVSSAWLKWYDYKNLTRIRPTIQFFSSHRLRMFFRKKRQRVLKICLLRTYFGGIVWKGSLHLQSLAYLRKMRVGFITRLRMRIRPT